MRLIYIATDGHVPLPGYNIVGSDISFSAVDNSINSITTDLSVGLAVGRWIRPAGSVDNDIWYSVQSIPSANKIIVNETVITEASGAAVNLDGFIHGDGQEYTIECHARQISPERERDVSVQLSNDKIPEVLKHYAGDMWSILTDDFTELQRPYFYEFLASTEAFETFQFDPYGYIASPGILQNVHADKPAQIIRVGNKMKYRLKFVVRVIA